MMKHEIYIYNIHFACDSMNLLPVSFTYIAYKIIFFMSYWGSIWEDELVSLVKFWYRVSPDIDI